MAQKGKKTGKVAFEIEIPMVFQKALLENPLVDSKSVNQAIQKAALEQLKKMYNNTKILSPQVKSYIEAMYGTPFAKNIADEEPKEKEAAEEEILQDRSEEQPNWN